MTSKMLLSVAGLAAFVTYCFQRGQCAKVAKAEVKEDVHRWESEGGNVPHVATPSPLPPQQGAHPGNGSTAPH